MLLLGGSPAAAQIELRRDLEVEPLPRWQHATSGTPAQQRHYQALRLFLRGQMYERDNRFVDAIKAYEEALGCEPDSPGILKALIPLCFSLDRDSQALGYCNQVLAREPDNYELRYRYACELLERGRGDEALEAMAKAVAVPEARENGPLFAQMNFMLGSLYEDRGDFTRAAAALERVVTVLDDPRHLTVGDAGPERRQIDQEAARTYEKLGRIELQARRYERAVAAYEKAQAKDPLRAGRLHYHLAEVHLAQKQLPAALDHLQKYIATQPGGAEAYELLINLLTELNRAADILPVLEQSAARDPFNQSLKMLLATQYVRANQARKAESIYLAALNDYPTEEAYRGLARLYQQQNRWSELVKKLDSDFGDPRHLPSARQQVQVLATDAMLVKGVAGAAAQMPKGGESLAFQTRRILATLCRQHKLHDLAEHFCRKCLADDPQPGEVYLELCRVLSEAQKWEAEAALCREALGKELKVPSMVFQLELSRSLALAGKDRQAVAAARVAMQQAKPDSDEVFQAHYTMCVALYRGQHLEQAVSEAEKLLKATSDSRGQRQVHYLLSTIHSARKDLAKSEEELQKVLAIDPEDATACNDLGYIWADQGKNLEEAERLVRKALELDRAARGKRNGTLDNGPAVEDNAAYVDSLGWVLFRRGRLDEACKELERAARLMPEDDPVIWEHLGEVYLEQGQRDRARSAWEKAIKLYEAAKRQDPERRQGLADKLRVLKSTAAGKKP
jgi:tetratricopeptide (TPR) repeat protein